MIFSDDYAVFDYETGGFLNTRGGRPVEVGILMYRDGKARIHQHLVNPCADDEMFVISLDAEHIHGISHDLIEADGLHPKMSSRILLQGVEDLPVWTHNGVKFDFELMKQECRRYGLTPIEMGRWRDTAALYKAWKIGKYPDQFPNLYTFMKSALNTRRRNLYFNLPYLTNELDLGVEILDEEGNPTGDLAKAAGWRVHPRLGIDEHELAKVENLGFHRAPFDCVVTHGLVQWCKRELAELFGEKAA